MNPTIPQLAGSILFALAVIHTFMVKKFEHVSHRYEKGSIGYQFFHFLGEVEAVFGMWAAIFVVFLTIHMGGLNTVDFLESMDFTEPAFVFVIMAMAATRPVLKFAEQLILFLSKLMPVGPNLAFFISALIFGPLLGSFITEPAAMTVTALVLQKNYFSKDISTRFKYAILGLLFVNISIGGTLTHFAAPPVLMVASKWGWDMAYMFGHFGYKAMIAVIINTLVISWWFRKELVGEFTLRKENEEKLHPTWWITLTHLLFLGLVVLTSHHMVVFFGVFLFFLGFTSVTQIYQDERVQLKESLLVGFFLGGLVILGSQQKWWLQPVLSSLDTLPLYLGATGLTAITDNAALTYLGSLVELTEIKKYFLVAGAVAGGGLTVIANAPNPAGYGILKENFGKEGISPIGLLKAALFPTLVALLCFQFLVSF